MSFIQSSSPWKEYVGLLMPIKTQALLLAVQQGNEDPPRKGGPHRERRIPLEKEYPTGKGGPHQAVTGHHLLMIPPRPPTMYRPQYGSKIRQQWGAETEVSHCLDKITSDCTLQAHIIKEDQWKTCEVPPPRPPQSQTLPGWPGYGGTFL